MIKAILRQARKAACLAAAMTIMSGCAPLVAGAPDATVNISAVADGWAANSVNVVVFRKNSLVSHGDTQYIAFYDGDAHVTLGKRKLGTSEWELKKTQLRGNVRDAHNAISIMVDGAGYLHLSWDHHNNALHYARGVAPGSLEMRVAPMTGQDEGSLSYPEFFRLPDGNLLFFYRDGGSGRGNLVVNRYDVAKGTWRRLHSNLIDGEGHRNAYWQACVDSLGTIHVSWVWRESPDVASNHDMGYARSRDGGLTWENSAGRRYDLPITAASAEYAARIPPNSELINQTSMAADADGHPYIASYWREPGSSVPQYRVLYHTGTEWRRLDLDFRKTPFSLSGQGTKAIPVSRPQIMIDPSGVNPAGLLVFRDRERGERASVVRIDDFSAARWSVRDLDSSPLGAWEPSFDTELWRREGSLHLFLQATQQVDGEGLGQAAPSAVQVLEWKPRFSSDAGADAATAPQVMSALVRANDYWQRNHSPAQSPFWDVAAYHTGNMAAWEVTRNEAYRQYSTAWAEHNNWGSATSTVKSNWKYNYGETPEHVLFGDWQVCFQTYIDLYKLDPARDPRKIARAREVMEYQMSTSKRDYWWWADGLYMVMPVMTRLHQVTGNPLYLDKLQEYFAYADKLMYDADAGLYYRDAKYVYPKHMSANGGKDFWARGDGWVFAGLAKVLADLPKDHPSRPLFVERFKRMAAVLKPVQQPGGYWTRSILDPQHAPGPESSGTAFFTYGYLWGMNNGYLDKAEYAPVVARSWHFLSRVALQADGRLGYVQPIGERAIAGQVVNQQSTAPFGVGAFLLAASEMYRYVNH
jgi:rhamnogalacturonyl hydrolase YesR